MFKIYAYKSIKLSAVDYVYYHKIFTVPPRETYLYVPIDISFFHVILDNEMSGVTCKEILKIQ